MSITTGIEIFNQPLVYQRRYNPATKIYSNNWEILHCRPASAPMILLPLEHGGAITIYPNLINKDKRDMIAKEILQYQAPLPNSDNEGSSNDSHLSLLRQYRIRNCNEPRLNCLLHTMATTSEIDNKSSYQPGYRYGTVTMKARSFNNLAHTYQFTKDMESIYQYTRSQSDRSEIPSVTETDDFLFNIGAHIVLYRFAHDRMGFHADVDQGETYILTTILSQRQDREIVVKPKPCPQKSDDNLPEETHYKIALCEGDAYSMDATVQQFYLHGVPKNAKVVKAADTLFQLRRQPIINNMNTEYQRLVIVFRRGTFKEFNCDSGRPISYQELQQTEFDFYKKRCYTFGDIPKALIERDIYTRQQLMDMGAHIMYQRSISGNKSVGCNAVILSGLKHNQQSEDIFDRLIFCATSKEGGMSLVTSHIHQLPIRVFRSSKYNSIYRAKCNKSESTCFCRSCHANGCAAPSKKSTKSAVYRYDGLYKIVKARKPPSISSTTLPFVFKLIKLWD